MPPWEGAGAGQSRGSADKQDGRPQKARREAGARTVGDANQDCPKGQASEHSLQGRPARTWRKWHRNPSVPVAPPNLPS